MVASSSLAVRKLVRAILVGALLSGVLYLILLTVALYKMGEPGPRELTVKNESGRPLLIERTNVPFPGAPEQSMLAWGTTGWSTNPATCEQDHLVARDLHGVAVASRDGACESDTWTITGQGLAPAPRYQPPAVPADRVEVRLVVPDSWPEEPTVAWWRALPRNLERAAVAGAAEDVSVSGPYVERKDLALYLRGPDAKTTLDFARAHLMRPSLEGVEAFVSMPGQRAPRFGVPLDPTATPTSKAPAGPPVS